MALFNLQVSKAEKFSLDLENTAFWAKSAVLTKGDEAFLYVSVQNQLSEVKTGDKKFCIAVLRKSCPNASLDLKFDSEAVTFSVEGNGQVELVGLKQKFEYSDDEADISVEEEEDESCPELEEMAPPTKKQKVEDSASKELAERKKIIEEKRKQDVEQKKQAEKKKAAEEAAKKQAGAEEAKKKAEEEKKKNEIKRKEAEKAKEKEAMKKKIEDSKKQAEAPGNKLPIKKVLPNGLKIEISKQGSGATAKPGRKVKVAYDGRLASNGKRFDKGSIEFKLGMGEVIRGWDEGVKGMQVGEKRKLLIPPSLGYGPRGAPPQIPGGAALVFDVELLRA